jgi:phage shock protein E
MIRLLAFVTALAAALSLAGCQSAAKPGPAAKSVAAASEYTTVDPGRFEELSRQSNIVILDVRTSAEYATGRIGNAVNINVDSADFAQQTAALDRNKTYLVYCRGGGRSTRACQTMQTAGFGKVYNLSGGISAWQAAGKPIQMP